MHTEEIAERLEEYGLRLEEDISSYIVYGCKSIVPIGWQKLDRAVLLKVNEQDTGYCTYVAIPRLLSKKATKQHRLELISQP